VIKKFYAHYIFLNFKLNNHVGLKININKIIINTRDSLYQTGSHMFINNICSNKTYKNDQTNKYSILFTHTIIMIQIHFIRKNVLSSGFIEEVDSIIYDEINSSKKLIIMVQVFINHVLTHKLFIIESFSLIAFNVFQKKLNLYK